MCGYQLRPCNDNLLPSEALYPEFDKFILHITGILMPFGYDTTEDSSQVDTYKKCKEYYNSTGRIRVWTGSSANTIYGSDEVNHAFRAWHDFIHITHNLPFDYKGELGVMQVQKMQCIRYHRGRDMMLFLTLLECEIKGQLDYYYKHRKFVANQREFTQQYLQEKYYGKTA